MTFQELITTLADKGDFNTSIGSFAWRAVEAWLNANGDHCENDEQQRLLVNRAVSMAQAERPGLHILIPRR